MTTRSRVTGVGLGSLVLGVFATLLFSAWHLGAFSKLRSLSPVREAHAAPSIVATATVRADGRVAAYPNASAVVGTETGGTHGTGVGGCSRPALAHRVLLIGAA